MPAFADSLRERRLAAGMTQRALAERAGISQPNIAAYESGRRVPSPLTLERLEQALVPSLAAVRAARDIILRAAAERHISRVRVFGSIARNEAEAGSDLDLLVSPDVDATLFDLAAFQQDVSELLGVRVDVVSDRGRGPRMPRILAEAVPL